MLEPTNIVYRVDPRLVHATLMNAWVPHVGAKTIVIADGAIEADARQRTIFEMSAMDAAEVRFTSEKDVRHMLPEVANDTAAIVLFSSLESALAALRHGLQFAELNLGHVPSSEDRKPIHPAVYLAESDYAVVNAIEGRGVRVVVQPLPTDTRRTVDGEELPAVSDAPEPDVAPEPVSEKLTAKLEIVNERGLHLRAAHVLAALAGKLEPSVQIGKDGNFVNAKSLLGITTLAATCGTVVDVIVEGPNAADAMAQLRALFASGFDEGAA